MAKTEVGGGGGGESGGEGGARYRALRMDPYGQISREGGKESRSLSAGRRRNAFRDAKARRGRAGKMVARLCELLRKKKKKRECIRSVRSPTSLETVTR